MKMNKLITTAAALVAVAATATACNRGAAANNSAGNSANSAAAPSATGNSTAAAPAAQGGEAEAEVRAFLDQVYAPYASADKEGPDLATLLEPQLAAAFEKREEGIDADPLIDAQDWTPFKPTYENVQVKGDRALATATFSNGATPTRIDYQLMRSSDGWRIYDVQSANGGSLRETVMNAAQ
jgi:ABC-type transporter MlaC component